MNDIMQIIRQRRSIRVYNTTQIPAEDIEKILEAGVNAPTGDNFKTTRFIVIREKEKLLELSTSRKAGTGMLRNADTAIVILGDANKTDLWVEDCAISAAYMHLTADALGYGSCWIQVRARDTADGGNFDEHLRRMFQFPAEIKPLCILSVGSIDKHPKGHSKEDVDFSHIHYERW